jgi:hypothetical protein
MKRSMNVAIWLRFTPVAAALLLSAANAAAQDATVGVGASTAVRPAAAPAAVVNTGSDHDMWIGHLGFGWFGSTRVPVGAGCCAAFPLAAGGSLATPAIGIRYWATPMIGIDVGLGLAMSSGSTTNAMNVSADHNSQTAFLLHGGVPIALAGSNHFSFQITPELDVGFGSGTLHNGAANTDQSGFLLQAGARAGAEIYFGFIGIPALALDGSVGLFLTSASGKDTVAGATTKGSTFFLGTSNITNPWDIFREDVAARYYF